MPARVTQGMLNAQMLRNLNNNLKRLSSIQEQMETGKKINHPSDDPVGIGFVMRYRSELSANEQYQRNADAAQSFLENLDSVMNDAGNILQQARELMVQGANDTNPDQALDSIASEIDQLYSQLTEVGNSRFNGKYIFNGQMTDVKPYVEGAAETANSTAGIPRDNGIIRSEIGPGIMIDVNVSGNQLFGDAAETDNAFKILKDVSQALRQGNTSAVGDMLENMDSRIDKLLQLRADIGARSNRLEMTQGRLEDMSINLTALQSKTEDANVAEVITNLKMAENVYQASLATGARIIQHSLVDFLR